MRRSSFFVLFLLVGLSKANAQWAIQQSHTTANLRGIHSVDGMVAWASGTRGTVIRTEDGGKHWQHCATPPDAEHLDFRGVQAFDKNTAVIMSSGKGDLSRLYKTTDACQSWKLAFTNPDKEGNWKALAFTEKSFAGFTDRSDRPKSAQDLCFGSVVGDPINRRFVIFITADCGDTWERQIRESPKALAPGETIVGLSNSALIVYGPWTRAFVTGGIGGARRLQFYFGTDDTAQPDPLEVRPGSKEFRFGTRIWTFERLPNPSPSASSGAYSFAHFEYRTVIVGGDDRNPRLGLAWYRHPPSSPTTFGISRHPPHGLRSAVAYEAHHNTWIAVGPSGTDISRNDGKTWTQLKPTPNETPDADKNWNALSLPFVVGPSGRIGKLKFNALTP